MDNQTQDELNMDVFDPAAGQERSSGPASRTSPDDRFPHSAEDPAAMHAMNRRLHDLLYRFRNDHPNRQRQREEAQSMSGVQPGQRARTIQMYDAFAEHQGNTTDSLTEYGPGERRTAVVSDPNPAD